MRAIAALLPLALVVAGSWLPVSASAQSTATLSPSSPSVVIALPPRAEGDLLQVEVTAVRNPKRAPVALRVTLQDADRRAPPEDVMRLALFPADQPGAAVARPDDALDRLRRSLGAAPTGLIAHIAFDLSGDAVPAAPPVELQLEARWTAAPRPFTPR
ncbi:MAG TPA: hypothetical protein PKV98_01745 [Burkholderiaceae bacterium]|nr:hypothetical protein [Burkholderiaceae bacterium]